MSQKFKSEVELQALNNATTDTDKFLVSDSGVVKYRTGNEVLSDLGITLNTASKLQHQVKAGVAINKGQAVYVTSADGTNMIVGLASNASEATSSKTMGLLDATVAINGFANVVTEGLLAGLNTVGANAGDPVWLGTGGNLIYGLLNKPYAPAHLVFIGIVTRVNANNGEIFVKVQNGFELNEIHDVDLKTTAPVNGHVLGFDGTLWVNKTIAGWLGYTPWHPGNDGSGSGLDADLLDGYHASAFQLALTNPVTGTGTTNYLPKFTGTTTLGNSQIFDNGTNVGIGTTSPASRLHVNASNSSEQFLISRSEQTNQGFSIKAGGGETVFNSFEGTNVVYGAYIFNSTKGTDTQERMRITSGGNVGIGATDTFGFKTLINSGNSSNNLILLSTTSGVNLTFNDLNTGVGSQIVGVANDLYVSTNNTERMRITNSGNVGIGTTSPGSKLSVLDSTYSSWATEFGNLAFSGHQVYTCYNNGSLRYGVYVSGGNGDSNSYDLLVAPSKFAVLGNGNVGIGTTSPSEKLEVNGTVKSNFPLGTLQLGKYSFGNGETFIEGGGDLTYSEMWFSTFGTERMRITSTGNVGIGTTSPGSNLHLYSASNTTMLVQDAGSVFRIVNANNAVYFQTATALSGGSSAPLIFTNMYGANEWMRITSGGNVGIGTTSPAEKLSVAGAIAITGGITGHGANRTTLSQEGTNGAYWQSYGANTSTAGVFALRQASSDFSINRTPLFIDTSGNVGIGTTSPQTLLQLGEGSLSNATTNQYLRVNAGGYNALSYAHLDLFNFGNNFGNSLGWRLTSGTEGAGVSVGRYLSFNTVVTDGSGNPSTSTERMRITSGGNVGIGTTTPGYKLDVEGIINVNATPGSYGTLMRLRDNVISGTESFGGVHFTSGPGTDYTIGKWSTAAGVGLLQIRDQSGNAFMTINGGGNVGIGTTSPSRLLSLSGAAYVDVVLKSTSASGVAGGGTLYFGNSSTDSSGILNYEHGGNFMNFFTAGSERMRITSTGNVGIGTTSPSGKLSLSDSSDLWLNISRGSSFVNIGVDSTGTFYNTNSNHRFLYNSGVNEAMRITSSGNVGIGTTSPATKLDVRGDSGTSLRISSNDNYHIGALSWEDGTITLGAGGYGSPNLRFSTAGSERMRITNSGNVGIGTTAPSYPLYVAAQVSNISIYADYDIVAYSDQSVKENIRPIENALERVIKSRGVLYDRTDSGEKDNIGFIAQELEIEFPELVVTNENGTKAVKYQNTIAVLFEAIKEQQKQIEELKQIVNGFTN